MIEQYFTLIVEAKIVSIKIILKIGTSIKTRLKDTNLFFMLKSYVL